MNAVTNDADVETVAGTIRLKLGPKVVDWSVSVPTALVPLATVLSTLFDLCNRVVTVVEEGVETSGKRISCAKGCGACCRQLVPISPSEVFWIRDVVEQMPADRQSLIRQRFQDANERLEAAQMKDRLLNPDAAIDANPAQFGLAYFALGIECPFLDEGSCSIHVDRPTVCREFLVTSPAINCADPNPVGVESVEIPVRVSRIVAELDNPGKSRPKWVALALALDDDAVSDRDGIRRKTGPEWIEAALAKLG